MSGLWQLLDVVLNKPIDALAAISVVVDLDKMLVVAKMNASSFGCAIAVNVEDLSVTQSNTL